MKIFIRICLFILGLIALIFAALFIYYSPFFHPRKTPAPASFDAADFPILRNLTSNSAIEVVRIHDLGIPFDRYVLPQLAMMYTTLYTDDEQSFYIAFDKNGDEVGRIPNSQTSYPMGATFLHTNGFHQLTKDGFGPLTPYVDLNNRQPLPITDLKSLHQRATLHRSISSSDMEKNSVEAQQKLTTHLMLIDGTWTRATTASPEYLSWKTVPFFDFDKKFRFQLSETAEPRPAKNFYNGKYDVQLTWFDQQEYFRKRGAPIGSPTGVGTPEHWRGIGYYTVSDGTGSIGFSAPYDMLHISGSGRNLMMVEGHETLNFILIQRFEGNRKDLYLFRSK